MSAEIITLPPRPAKTKLEPDWNRVDIIGGAIGFQCLMEASHITVGRIAEMRRACSNLEPGAEQSLLNYIGALYCISLAMLRIFECEPPEGRP